MDDKRFKELCDEVKFRTDQLNLLYSLLIKDQAVLWPVVHLFGLTGTGKSYTIRKFMNKFCGEANSSASSSSSVQRYTVYINCNELFYASLSSLFNDILAQIKSALNVKLGAQENNPVEMSFTYENESSSANSSGGDLGQNENMMMTDDAENGGDLEDIKMNDTATFLSQLRRMFQAKRSQQQSKSYKRTCLYFVLDNAESLKYLNDASNLFLALTKLNEYINLGCDMLYESDLSVCTLFVSEIDWSSLISECDLMSRTEAPRPFSVFFNEYTKDEMYYILVKTTIQLLDMQKDSIRRLTDTGVELVDNKSSNHSDIEFYVRMILGVFFPICKDLNELQYLIQIYYDQLMCSINSNEIDTKSETDTYKKMLSAWNNMKPFLKQALTQIYLRQSMFETGSKKLANIENTTNTASSLHQPSFLNNKSQQQAQSMSQLPKLMKYLLISAYIATHNPTKLDKKLFDYNATNKNGRRTKFTAQRFQLNEENQRAAALKTQNFDFNRLMSIFVSVCHGEHVCQRTINLSQIQLNLKTLKSLHYLQQNNSSYSGLDEPKYKCIVDFETIQNLANSVNFNIKQYLAEYITTN